MRPRPAALVLGLLSLLAMLLSFQNCAIKGAPTGEADDLASHQSAQCLSTEVLWMGQCMTPERDPAFPKVPTLNESGIKVELVGWGGFAVPKGTPKPVLTALSSALKKAASSDEFKTFITSRGMIVSYRNPDDFKSFVNSQYVFFNDLLSKMELGK